MRTLINWIISKLRRRNRLDEDLRRMEHHNLRMHIHKNGITLRQGRNCIRLSHSDYLLLEQLRGWQVGA